MNREETLQWRTTIALIINWMELLGHTYRSASLQLGSYTGHTCASGCGRMTFHTFCTRCETCYASFRSLMFPSSEKTEHIIKTDQNLTYPQNQFSPLILATLFLQKCQILLKKKNGKDHKKLLTFGGHSKQSMISVAKNTKSEFDHQISETVSPNHGMLRSFFSETNSRAKA